ncbi:hypothetical protein [Glycomyces artemisiae]|uniref:Uncharacterized protein n=1 Tax=Glycomyces artemisiae TaxID=1076443 RepID=A0A2T0UEP8_9ACTN|nr:hypothetical protein [Glycomyces artemisiae]PRY56416.1 hypothetical protein B0I28_10965 [Glycomyces artemisiae]
MQHPSEMTPADLRSLRRLRLGLSIGELAAILGTDARDAPAGPDEPALARSVRQRGPLHRKTIEKWESGTQPISAPNAEALARLIRYTDDHVDALAAAHRRGSTIPTYATDGELHAAEPGLWPSLPASWHQAAAWRAAQRLGGGTDYAVPRTDDSAV